MAALSTTTHQLPLTTDEKVKVIDQQFRSIELHRASEKAHLLKSHIDIINERISQKNLSTLEKSYTAFNNDMAQLRQTIFLSKELLNKIKELIPIIEESLTKLSTESMNSISTLNAEQGRQVQLTQETAENNLASLRCFQSQIEQFIKLYEQLQNHTLKRLEHNITSLKKGDSPNSLVSKIFRYVDDVQRRFTSLESNNQPNQPLSDQKNQD